MHLGQYHEPQRTAIKAPSELKAYMAGQRFEYGMSVCPDLIAEIWHEYGELCIPRMSELFSWDLNRFQRPFNTRR